jgi:hypothetical protein
MRRAFEVGVLGLVIVALVVTSGQGAVIDVSGRVVDRHGAPVAGAQIAMIWHFDETGPSKTFKSSRSDADGRFTLECDFYLSETAVMAMDAPGERGGITIIRRSEAAKPLKIELGPLVEVRGHFTCAESGKAPVGTEVTIHRMPGYFAIARCHSKGSTFSLRLPPGQYTFHGGGPSDDYVEVQWNDTLKSGKRRDLGAVDLKLSPIARDRAENDRLEKWLKQSVPFDFNAEPLKNVVALLAQKTGERFVLDPIARKAGTVAPTAVVTGRSRGQPLGLALKQLLAPLGMTCIVRDEAIVLTKCP